MRMKRNSVKMVTIETAMNERLQAYQQSKEDDKLATLENVREWCEDNWTEHKSFGFSIVEHIKQQIAECKKKLSDKSKKVK